MRFLLLLAASAFALDLDLNAQVKLAAQARVDLVADAAVGSIDEGALLSGSGSVNRMNWRTPAEQPRTYTVNMDVNRFSWSEFAFRFVPAKSGRVTISLLGPWEEVSPGSGTIYKQEVLWDTFSAEGATLSNGSFEMGSATAATGWSGGVVQASSDATPAEDGARMLRTWHNGPSTRALTVTAGQPVSLRFFARAFVPPNHQDMKRISGETPAHIAARKFMRGANLGNYLEAPPNTWGSIVYTAEDFRVMRAEGFDHARLPIAWHHYAGPGPQYTLSPAIFQKVDFLVTNAVKAGIGAMINIHHFDDFTSNPAANTNKFYAIWEQIARRYADQPDTVTFELLNEPRDAATTAVLNPIYAEVIRRIRLTNPNRTIFLGPSQWNAISELPNLRLPDNDTNIIVTVHSYEPFYFTHQGATWTSEDSVKLRNIVFPGPPAQPLTPPAGISSGASNWVHSYNTQPTASNPSSASAFESRLRMAKDWSDYYGRPVHVGEFGAYELADPTSRANFYREMRRVMDQLGLGWAIWDWKAGFHYIKNGQPDPPAMREALFPKERLRALIPGLLELDSAVGKTQVIYRTFALNGPWEPVTTQTLTSPLMSVSDPAATNSPKAFYRSKWVR